MTSYPVMPGVPAAGHVTSGGSWHAGSADTCPKAPCAPPAPRVAPARGAWSPERQGLLRRPCSALLPGHRHCKHGHAEDCPSPGVCPLVDQPEGGKHG